MKKLFAGMLLAMSASAWAGEVQVNDAWARATAPGQDSAAVAMRIVSQKDGAIVSVSSDAAASAEIHSMVHEGGMMKMRALEALPLKAKQEVALGADGNHLMLIGLKKPLKEGESVALNVTVRFADKKQEVVKVTAAIRPLTQTGHQHMHHHH